MHNIYRPPPSTTTKCRSYVPFAQFLSDFKHFLSSASTTPHDFLITGDFNIHLDCPTNSDSSQFLSTLSAFNLMQFVNFPTHISSKHTLDLVIAPTDTKLEPATSFSPTSASDHYPIITRLSLSKPPPPVLVTKFFRCLKSINLMKFQIDIVSSKLITNPSSSLSELVACYNSTLSSLLDKHAPLKSKSVSQKPKNPWFTPVLHSLKSNCRRLRRIWSSSHSAIDHSNLRSATNHYHASILKAKRHYYHSTLVSSKSNPKSLWTTINKILMRTSTISLPSFENAVDLSNKFASFFSTKINDIRTNLQSNSSTLSPHTSPPSPPPLLTEFAPATCDEIAKLISSSNNSSCELDPIPTSLLKNVQFLFLPSRI